MTLRSRVGRLASRVYPGLDEKLWNRKRDEEVAALSRSESYRMAVAPTVERLRSTGPVGRNAAVPHLLVLAHEGPGFDSWDKGTRNLYYEALTSFREQHGHDAASVLDVPVNSAPEIWHPLVISALVDRQVTHILTHIESDPSTTGEQWTWDVLWQQIHELWGGVLLGVMFDSAFTWIAARSRRLARISDHFLVVDICMPMDGRMVRGRPEVGPVNMPLSDEALALVDERIRDLPKEHDVSFIGALYPYRVELLDRLRARGFDVAVNPHRPDETTDFTSSRTNQPSWLDYMAGLAQSHLTINFSRSSAGPFEQLKTRVIEGALAGTIVLTDDKDRTRLFLEPGFEFGQFTSLDDLPEAVTLMLQDKTRLTAGQESARARARHLARTNFWSGIDDGLARRGLRPLHSMP